LCQKCALRVWLLMKNNLCLALCLAVLVVCASAYTAPKFSVRRLNGGRPILTEKDSVWLYNYNTAYMPYFDGDKELASLAVRVQNLTLGAKNIYDVGPSSIAFALSRTGGLSFSPISAGNTIVAPGPGSELGCEDPRVVYDHKTKTYYMFYTAVTKGTTPSDLGDVKAMLSLAINSRNPASRGDWKLLGYVFPELKWSKSAALLLSDEQFHKHYLFWGDSDICVATTENLIHYNNTGKCLIKTRSDKFDSQLVESGPEPLRLSDGNYLFLYNSARKADIPNPKPGWDLEYNLGWSILDKRDPTNVLARSEQPILSPELDWEKCDKSPAGLTPNVVFVEGWRRLADDSFLVWYQGCDSRIGIFHLSVSF